MQVFVFSNNVLQHHRQLVIRGLESLASPTKNNKLENINF